MEKQEKPILVTRSSMPSFEEFTEMIRPIWDSAWLTNMGEYHQELERQLKEYMKTDEYVEEAAREKLGLVKDNEIVFQEEN